MASTHGPCQRRKNRLPADEEGFLKVAKVAQNKGNRSSGPRENKFFLPMGAAMGLDVTRQAACEFTSCDMAGNARNGFLAPLRTRKKLRALYCGLFKEIRAMSLKRRLAAMV